MRCRDRRIKTVSAGLRRKIRYRRAREARSVRELKRNYNRCGGEYRARKQRCSVSQSRASCKMTRSPAVTDVEEESNRGVVGVHAE